MKMFDKLIEKLYYKRFRKTATEVALMARLEADAKRFNPANQVSDDYAETLRWLEVIPAGVSIRRVRPRDGGNMWAVAYHDSPSYYGHTLSDAFGVMQKSCTTIQDQFDVVTLGFVKGDRCND